MTENDFLKRKEELDLYNLSPQEFLFFVLLYYKVNYGSLVKKFLKSGMISYEGRIPTIRDKNILNLIENNLEPEVFGLTPVKYLDELASKLMEVYPSGLKPGIKGVSWRGSHFEIKTRLQKLQELTGQELDTELAVEATKQYIASFGDNTTYMPILKYFIFKNEIKDGHYEFKSELLANMDTIASGGTIEKKDTDWISELR